MTRPSTTRRQFLRDLGLKAATLPFLLNLPSLAFANNAPTVNGTVPRKKRLVMMFSPNGVVPDTFWPTTQGEDFALKETLQPLEPFKNKTLILKGLCNKLAGDGDGHMRGIGGLLTGIDLFPGNIQGGADTPAGWSRGHSIDQEIARFLLAKPESSTRFGSLEFGVRVPDRAETRTRMCYTGPNQPLAPISNPYQMFQKLYGQNKDMKLMASVLDSVGQDLRKLSELVSIEDRRLIEQHADYVRESEKEFADIIAAEQDVEVPTLPLGERTDETNMPRLSRMQIDLMMASFRADFTRIATIQYTNSASEMKMTWLGVNDGHHHLSHEPNQNQEAQIHLTNINKWYCGELAYLIKCLSETTEPGTNQTMLDNTLVIWGNELGKGNSHTRDNIPFVCVGNGLDWKMGRSLKYDLVPHNRLLMSLAHGFDNRVTTFGNTMLSADGPLNQLTG